MDNLLALAFIFFALYGLCHLIYVSIRTTRRGIEFKTYRNSDYISIQIRFRRFRKSNSPHSTDTETLAPAVRNEVEGKYWKAP